MNFVTKINIISFTQNKVATHTAIIIEIYINLIKILIKAFTVKLILWHAVIHYVRSEI